MPHLLGALVVVFFILGLALAVIYRPEYVCLHHAGKVLLAVASVQVFVGLGLFSMTSMDVDPLVTIVATVVHATTGALTLAATVAMAILVLRHLRDPDTPVSSK